jgi:serine/threonine-protein kinase
MASIRTSLIALAVLYFLFGILLAMASFQLPPNVASHFGFSGEANGWMGRTMYLVFMALFGMIFPMIPPLAGLLMGRVPTSVINLPNKEYWLAPERRAGTMAFLISQLLRLAVLELGLVIVLHQLVVDANRQQPPRMSNVVWGVLAVFLVFMAAWIWSLIRHFKLPQASAP